MPQSKIHGSKKKNQRCSIYPYDKYDDCHVTAVCISGGAKSFASAGAIQIIALGQIRPDRSDFSLMRSRFDISQVLTSKKQRYWWISLSICLKCFKIL